MGRRRILDLTGKKFGHLTALSPVPSVKPDRKYSYSGWFVRCDCGAEKVVGTSALTTRKTKSCGREACAFHTALFDIKPTSMPYRVMTIYRSNAARRGLEFHLSLEDVIAIIFSSCHYCGQAPMTKCETSNVLKRRARNGIDRIDNTKGYTRDNVVPCCHRCNTMKMNMTILEFVAQIRRLYGRIETISNLAEDDRMSF